MVTLWGSQGKMGRNTAKKIHDHHLIGHTWALSTCLSWAMTQREGPVISVITLSPGLILACGSHLG